MVGSSVTLILLALVWLTRCETHPPNFPARIVNPGSCTALKTVPHFENTTITDASYVFGGSGNVSTPDVCQSSATVTSNVCRVQFYINTTKTSCVHGEAWLPDPDEWHGRFLALGNRAAGGCIDYTNLDYGSTLGFATIGTDAGHSGDTASPLLNAPEVINDFSWRAIHVSAVLGKQLVSSYYASSLSHSYYLGCSAGGRQGTQAVLKYPDDFDGVVAGAPATDYNSLQGWSGMLSTYIGAPDPLTGPNSSFLDGNLWDVVSAEIMDQCDMLDGLKDGIITEPDDCDFRPQVIACTANPTQNCLASPQVNALESIYSPLYSNDGTLIFPRYDPGAEGNGNYQYVFNGEIFPMTQGWYANAVYNDSNYDFEHFSTTDIAFANNLDPGDIATTGGDFSAFKARGGKLITFHGRADQIIASGNSKRIYELIASTMSSSSSASAFSPISPPVPPASLDDFYRLFLVPGMEHCTGGLGQWNFGQDGIATNIVNASSHNVLLALVDWVENDVAPETIIGTGVGGAVRTHCRWPAQMSVWNGTVFVCEDAPSA